MDVKPSSGSRQVAVANLLVSSNHWLAGWQGRGRQPLAKGLFLFSTLFLVEDQAVTDQFLKGETMMVHQV